MSGVTNCVLSFFRIQSKCPELLSIRIESGLFKLPENVTSDNNSSSSSTGEVNLNTPKGMAKRFNVPYLGKLPMDPNMMRACEEGKSFLEIFPDSVAAKPFLHIVQNLIQMTTANYIASQAQQPVIPK